MYLLIYKDKEGFTHALHRAGHILAYRTLTLAAAEMTRIEISIRKTLKSTEKIKVPILFGMMSKTVEVPAYLSANKRLDLEQIIRTLNWTTVQYPITSMVDLDDFTNDQ